MIIGDLAGWDLIHWDTEWFIWCKVEIMTLELGSKWLGSTTEETKKLNICFNNNKLYTQYLLLLILTV